MDGFSAMFVGALIRITLYAFTAIKMKAIFSNILSVLFFPKQPTRPESRDKSAFTYRSGAVCTDCVGAIACVGAVNCAGAAGSAVFGPRAYKNRDSSPSRRSRLWMLFAIAPVLPLFETLI